MVAVLGPYNPIFYAQQALRLLYANMGMARAVHLGYDAEHRTFNRGDVIQIKKPFRPTVQDAPGTAEELSVETITATLDRHKTTKFKVSDKDHALASSEIIRDHIAPSARELANFVDKDLNSLYTDVPWFHDLQATPTEADLVDMRKIMSTNNVPLNDVNNMFAELDPTFTAALLKTVAFSQNQGGGEAALATQMMGTLGRKYSMFPFENQNVKSHVKGTSTQTALLLVGAHAKGATTVTMDAVAVTGTLVKGDTFIITGSSGTQRYAVTATTTAGTPTANTFTNVPITPPLAKAHLDNDPVTVSLDDHVANLGFHREAFAFISGKLPDFAEFPGIAASASVASIQDPLTGLALRSRMYYMADLSEMHVALDILYTVKTLDPNLAVRGRG